MTPTPTPRPSPASTTTSDPSIQSNPRLVGWSLIAFSVGSTIAFGVLAASFNFPEILREPGADVLEKFHENASVIRPTYWVLAMTGLVLIGLSLELARLVAPAAPGAARLVGAFGTATGIFWSLGYARWPIAVPNIAEQYATGDEQSAVELYELLNRYAGMTVGEHLGFICMGIFAVALAVGLRRGGIGPTWLYPVGLVGGGLIAVTAYEQYNTAATIFGALNGLANTIWFLWLLAIGVVLVRSAAATPEAH